MRYRSHDRFTTGNEVRLLSSGTALFAAMIGRIGAATNLYFSRFFAPT
ncbi:hypothetical protein [Burkholderia sp. WAC0059]|nr:hypothetical protein [Burkholderia sp. WAC0059]